MTLKDFLMGYWLYSLLKSDNHTKVEQTKETEDKWSLLGDIILFLFVFFIFWLFFRFFGTLFRKVFF